MLSAKGCRSSSAGCMDAGAPLVHGRHGRGPMLGCGRSAAPAASGRRTTRVASRCGLCLLCVCAVCMARYMRPGSRIRNRWVSHTREAPDEHIAECALRRGALPVDLCNGHAGNSYTRRRVSTVCLIRACSRRSGVRAGSAAECADESPRPGCIIDPKYTILRTLAHLTRLSLLETCRLNPPTQ